MTHVGNLNAYASCAATLRMPENSCVQRQERGAVTFLVANIGPTPLSVTLGGGESGASQCVWQVRSKAAAAAAAAAGGDGNAASLLGSQSAQWRDGSGEWTDLALGSAPGFVVPDLANPPASATGSPIALGAYEYAFVAVPGAGGDACLW